MFIKCILAICCCFALVFCITASLTADVLKIADSPVAVTSFGAAVCDGYLYLYGGNEATAHSFSMDGQNNVFRRVKLESSSQNDSPWEELGEVPRRQGNALVSYNGKLYRLGGFEARNKTGAGQDLNSSNEFMTFDPVTKKWTALTDLPEPRSSFDAVVLGNTLFVVGGWSLNGKDNETNWHQTAWKIDLSDPEANWKAIKEPPFVRRANSVGHYQDKLYVIGGMAKAGGPTTEVAVYDPQRDTWSEGPQLPGDNMQGFGSSTFNVGGNLIVSTANGQILKLNDDGSDWVKIHKMDAGRFFHRLVAIDNHRFAILCGTGGKTGKQRDVVVYDLGKLNAPEKTASTADAGKK